MKKMNLHNEVARTLEALDNVGRAEISKDFERQLAQRISFLHEEKSLRWLRYCAAAMLVMALVNGATLTDFFSNSSEESDSIQNVIYQPIDYTTFE